MHQSLNDFYQMIQKRSRGKIIMSRFRIQRQRGGNAKIRVVTLRSRNESLRTITRVFSDFLNGIFLINFSV